MSQAKFKKGDVVWLPVPGDPGRPFLYSWSVGSVRPNAAIEHRITMAYKNGTCNVVPNSWGVHSPVTVKQEDLFATKEEALASLPPIEAKRVEVLTRILSEVQHRIQAAADDLRRAEEHMRSTKAKADKLTAEIEAELAQLRGEVPDAR